MSITDTVIHEIDIIRWLLDHEIATTMVLTPRRTSRASSHLQDPLIVILETSEGVVVDVAACLKSTYGYYIRCEVVGESGTVSLAGEGDVVLRRGGLRSGGVPLGSRERFAAAYDTELQAWVDSVAAGETEGPSSWDGYTAAVVADACLEALRAGSRTEVTLNERPAFYERDDGPGEHRPAGRR
jgi:myo-inositol 2-dehydrogenase/D-chiro-inositol 1-dehydrogenase